jgi:hypothetical protein
MNEEFTMLGNIEDYAPAYQAFIQQNKQLLVNAAQERQTTRAASLGVTSGAPTITLGDLQIFHSPQLLLDMMQDEFLDALQDGVFTLVQIAQVCHGFCEHYLHIVQAGHISEEDLSPASWVNMRAEQDMSLLIHHLVTAPYLNALRNSTYNMTDVCHKAAIWGPKAVYCLHPDLVEAIAEERIINENIIEMSCEELEEAIYENRYPQDSTHSYHS